MHFEAHGVTDVGRQRSHNEDHFLVDPTLSLYIVCDGMGGHAAGDLASKKTADIVREYVSKRKDLLESVVAGEVSADDVAALLRHGLQSASAQVHEMGLADPKRKGMGTTCTALLLVGGKAVMGHVGDSRLYMARADDIFQLSDDHTFVQEALRRGVLTPEQAENSVHQNIVTRAIGPNPSVLVDTLVFDVLPGDVLLLCSDGLHNYYRDSRELHRELYKDTLEEVTRGLVNAANERGGADNITVLTLRAVSPDTTPDARSDIERASRISSELEALGHIILFSELDMRQLVKVANAFRPQNLPEDHIVVHEGDVSENLFVIVNGGAKVLRGQQEIASLVSGDHFGEMALLSRRPRSATVRTTKPTRLLTLDRDSFYRIVQSDAVVGAKILWRLAQTLSMRLDDAYMHHDRQGFDEDLKKSTQTYGLFPSPFDGH